LLEPPARFNGPIVHGFDGLTPEGNFRHLRPARIDEGRAPSGNEIGAALLQDVLAGLPAHALGEWALSARGGRRAE
jgi:hypothetical protein